MSLLEQFLLGDSRALSRIITWVENRRDGYRKLLKELFLRSGNSLRVGITGPPGAGKSTLVNALTGLYLAEQKRVGIVAVDPTSPFTGGALLGDRVRMNEFPPDGRVFFRSMATRGAPGGLAGTTDNVAMVLDAFGFDIVIIETVGVGQVELDIIDSCDVVIVVVVPESGDAVQTMKAGLMEIADIMVVNKADRTGAERLVDDLQQAMHFQKREKGEWQAPVIATTTARSESVRDLFEAVLEYEVFLNQGDRRREHRQAQLGKKVVNILRYHFRRDFLDPIIDQVEFNSTVEAVVRGETDPFTAGEQLYQQYSQKTINSAGGS